MAIKFGDGSPEQKLRGFPNNLAIAWDLEKQRKVFVRKLKSRYVKSAAIDKAGKVLVLGGVGGEMDVTAIPSGEVIHSVDTTHRVPENPSRDPDVFFVDISSDGKTIVSRHLTNSTSVWFNQLWEVSNGKPVKSSCETPRVLPDNKTFVTSEGNDMVFRSEKTTEILRWMPSKKMERRVIDRMVVSDDGKTIAATYVGWKTIHLWTVPKLAP